MDQKMTGSKKLTLKSFLILQTIQEKTRYRTDAITDSGLQLTEIVLRHFKKFFARLMGMKKLIFNLSNFFGSGHFLIHEILKKWPKIDRSKKNQNTKKSVASCLSTTRRNFWILFMLWPNFYDWFLKLWAVISRWRNIFSKNFLAQIIIYGWYFGWFNVERNPKTLDDL